MMDDLPTELRKLPFKISDKILAEIVATLPRSMKEIRAIKGVGPVKAKEIGRDVIKTVKRCCPAPRPDPWEMSHEQYLKSPEWKSKCKEAYDFFGRSCMFCGKETNLQVHHRRYRTEDDQMIYGREKMTDLSVICGFCHRLHHKRFRIKQGRLEVKRRSRSR